MQEAIHKNSNARTNAASLLAGLSLLFAMSMPSFGSERREEVEVKVNWTKVERISRTIPTLQVVVNPLLRRGAATHSRAFQALHDLEVDDARYVPWFPYPRLAVAELEAPTPSQTFW